MSVYNILSADTIEAFLNFSLECPLPVGALAALTELLGISADTENAKRQLDFNANAAVDVEANDAIGMGDRQIFQEENVVPRGAIVRKVRGLVTSINYHTF